MNQQAGSDTALERNSLGTAGIVFLVLAAVTPMAAVVGVILLGDGAGLPGAYVLAGLVLLLFSVGYAAMSHHVTNAGAFYAYIAKGVGRPFGASAATVAVISYNAVMISITGAFGYFAHSIISEELHITVAWEIWVAALLLVVLFLGNRQLEISARILGAALCCEMLVLLVLDVAILGTKGLSAFSLDVFKPSVVFSGTPGVALLYGFYTFIGFEATAIFGEEAREPRRSVPRATFISVAVIAVFYTATSWSLIAGYGTEQVQAVAAQEPGNFVFQAGSQFIGSAATHIMHFLIITSLFAAVLAVHNATSRYFFALGREGLLPRKLSETHPKYHSPYIASRTQIVIAAVVIAAFAIGGADPYLELGTSMGGLGTLGIVALQAGASIAAVGFFRKRKDSRLWTTLIAPGLGAAGLIAACVLILHNFSALTGKEHGIVNDLPWLLLIAALGGLAYAFFVKDRRPEIYEGIGSGGSAAIADGVGDGEVATSPVTAGPA